MTCRQSAGKKPCFSGSPSSQRLHRRGSLRSFASRVEPQFAPRYPSPRPPESAATCRRNKTDNPCRSESTKTGRRADKSVEPGADQRQARHLESAQHELRHKRNQRQVKRPLRQPRQDRIEIFSRRPAGTNARHEAAVLAQIVSHFFDVENDRDVEEREEDNQRKKDQLVIGIAGMKGLKEVQTLAHTYSDWPDQAETPQTNSAASTNTDDAKITGITPPILIFSGIVVC
jgi:hypothetical protein